MNVEAITPPGAGRELAVYHTFLLHLADDARLCARRLGRICWLQGCALREARKVCVRGDWLRLLNAIGMKETTAKYLRRIAEVITERESLSLSYTEMLARCYPSYQMAMEKDLADEDAAGQDAKPAGPCDPVKTPVNDTVKNLTVCLKRLQRTPIPPEPPADAADADTVENLRQLLGRIDAEVARIRTAIDRWTPGPTKPPPPRARPRPRRNLSGHTSPRHPRQPHPRRRSEGLAASGMGAVSKTRAAATDNRTTGPQRTTDHGQLTTTRTDDSRRYGARDRRRWANLRNWTPAAHIHPPAPPS